MGRVAQNPVWVFGMVDTRFEPARGYMEIVQRRDRATLAPIMDRVFRPNTVVHSDEWRAYINLPQHVANCAAHDTVNHTRNFVNPVTGAHTQVRQCLGNRDFEFSRGQNFVNQPLFCLIRLIFEIFFKKISILNISRGQNLAKLAKIRENREI